KSLMAIGADGPIRASVILASRSGASARGLFETISHGAGAPPSSASVTGDAILRQRREHGAHEAHAPAAWHGSRRSDGGREFWQGGSQVQPLLLRCIYSRGD